MIRYSGTTGRPGYGAVIRLEVRCNGTAKLREAWERGNVFADVWWCKCDLVRCVCDVVRIRAGLGRIKINRGWGTVGT